MSLRDAMFLLIGISAASLVWATVIIFMLRYLDKPIDDDELLMKRNWPVK